MTLMRIKIGFFIVIFKLTFFSRTSKWNFDDFQSFIFCRRDDLWIKKNGKFSSCSKFKVEISFLREIIVFHLIIPKIHCEDLHRRWTANIRTLAIFCVEDVNIPIITCCYQITLVHFETNCSFATCMRFFQGPILKFLKFSLKISFCNIFEHNSSFTHCKVDCFNFRAVASTVNCAAID